MIDASSHPTDAPYLVTTLGDLVRMSTEVTLDVVSTEITVSDHFRADEFESVSDRAEFLAGGSIGDRPRGHQVENFVFDLHVNATSFAFFQALVTYREAFFAILQ